MKLVLASRSPRRKELLAQIGKDFEILTADTDETLPENTPIERGVEILALRKGRAVADLLSEKNEYRGAFIVSSDTLVELDGVPLGKPKDEADAARMLRALSGRTHAVRTGVAVHRDGKAYSGVASAYVTFRTLTDAEIAAYIATGEPMDKAGSYGIQGKGGALVAGYTGDFDTIMGLSVALTRELIAKAGEN